ncbi:hypothetical protein N9A73_02640, partial [Akkermansiaceae bacterium]|nr:hypothetical protein [Akkermansiaceae bacterium]
QKSKPMRSIIKALLIASFCLPFVSCKDEKSIQQEVHEKLEKQVEALLAKEKEEKAAAEEADGKDQE